MAQRYEPAQDLPEDPAWLAQLDDWVEREARQIEAGRSDAMFTPGALAEQFEDRKGAQAAQEAAAAADPFPVDPFAIPEQDPNERRLRRAFAAIRRLRAGIARPAERTALGSNREIISGVTSTFVDSQGVTTALQDPSKLRRQQVSSLERYLRAARKVDHAFAYQLAALQREIEEAGDVWSSADLGRLFRLGERREAIEARREATRRCVVGDFAVFRFVCTCCGSQKLAGEDGCHRRTCPRCAPNERRKSQSKIHDALEALDQRRRADGRALPRWRFLTLTMPSLPDFEPMRRLMGRAFGRLVGANVWRDNVRAGLSAWETTHTRAGWHVHVHGLVDGFIPRPKLIRTWQVAILRELLRDATDARQVWRGEDLRPETVRAAQRLARLGGRRPCVRQVESSDAAERQQLIELADLVPAAVEQLLPVERTAATAQLMQLLALCPTGAGVDIRDAGSDRQRMIRELVKYLGKDLAGAPTTAGDGGDSTFGVAGTARRLGEFFAGSFRWRSKRTYGDLFDPPEIERAMECDDCGEHLMQFDGRSWVTRAEWQRIKADKKTGPPLAQRDIVCHASD